VIIPQGKVLVRAGRFEGGKLPYTSYTGQIKPADIAKIIFWGAEGDDTTGDGSHANPYETFDRALEAFSTIAHKWILRTDLGVYDQPGSYVTDPADRVYLDPTRPDDSGDGLTPATAKKTYGAAKTALSGSGRSVIHCIGSFTLTDKIDAPTQGEIGETLTYDASAEIQLPPTVYSENNFVATDFSINPATGTIIASGVVSAMPTRFAIRRSTDGGATWSSVTLPPIQNANSVGVCVNGVWVVLALRRVGAAGTNILRSIDDGVTWTVQTLNNRGFSDLIYSNGRFVAVAQQSGFFRDTFGIWSTDGITWNEVNFALTNPTQIWMCRMTHDGAGNIMAVGYRLILPNSNVPIIVVSTNNGNSWTDISATLIGSAGYAIPLSPLSAWRANGKWYVYCEKVFDAEIWATADLISWTRVQTSYRYVEDNGVMNPISGAKFDATELYGVPVMYSRITPSATRGFASVGDTSSTYLSADFPFLSSQPVTGQRIIKYNGLEYHFSGVREYPATTGVIRRIPVAQTSIWADCANVKMHASRLAAIAANVRAVNLTSEPTTGLAVLSLTGCSIIRSRAVSNADGLAHYGGKLVLRRCLVKSSTTAAQINGTALAANDIELSQSVLVGAVNLNNPSGTDKEYIEDNIIEGSFSAAALVTVSSNIRGSVTGTTAISKISSVNPVFVDTIDYFLSRVALGQAADSPLVKRSTAFSYTYNSQTYKDDFGPYRSFVALVTTLYKRSFLLPKFSGEALSEDVQNSAKLLRSINGVPDVSNRPSARMELISWEAKTIDENVREAVSYMERERNTGVELFYDFEPTMLDGVTVNGAHPAETFEINIQPKDIPVGTAIIVDGKTRYVVQRYPRSGDATKIVIDDVLQGGLSNGQVLDIELMQGGGSFVFVPQETRKNRRVFSRRRDAYKGMVFTFARKLT